MKRISRRDFINRLGWTAFLGTVGGFTGASIRFLFPNVLYEPPKEYKIGYPLDYPEGVNFIADKRIFVIRSQDRIQVVSAVCTHIGCTLSWSGEDREWKCPCHGSVFNEKGAVVKGPAPKALPWYGVFLSPDGRLFVNQNQTVPPGHSLIVKV